MINSLYAVFRKYCRGHGEPLILGAFDQFVFIYFTILLINCEKRCVFSVYFCLEKEGAGRSVRPAVLVVLELGAAVATVRC